MPLHAFLAFQAALLMSLLAPQLSMATYVPEAESEGLLLAASLAVASLLAVGASWHHLPRLIRVLGGGIVLLSGFALFTVGDRCIW